MASTSATFEDLPEEFPDVEYSDSEYSVPAGKLTDCANAVCYTAFVALHCLHCCFARLCN